MSGTRALETNTDINRNSNLIPFEMQVRTRIVFGNDSIEQLGSLAVDLGAQRVMVVTDPGIIQAGHVARGLYALSGSGLEHGLFDGARENPTTEHVKQGVAFAKDFRPDLLVGLGGGSAMDCAKGVNFIYSCGGEMKDYHGVDKATKPMLPMIAVPTTSGTGSEMQSFALISDEETHVKMACGDKKASCAVALLDPKLTLTQPSQVTALTGIDAVSHALETWVTKPRNPVSMLFSREAWRLLANNFLTVMQQPDNLQARGGMLLGAAYAGLAIENSMLGAAHALANPLTATYDLTHGQAVGAMLPHVIRFNGEQFDDWYSELLALDLEIPDLPASGSGSERIAQLVDMMAVAAGLENTLQGCGVQREQIPQLAKAASQQWTGNFNPRPVDSETLALIYEKAY